MFGKGCREKWALAVSTARLTNFVLRVLRALRFCVYGAQQLLGISGGGIFGDQILGDFRSQAGRANGGERRDDRRNAAPACNDIFDLTDIGGNLKHLVNTEKDHDVYHDREHSTNNSSSVFHGTLLKVEPGASH